MEKWNFYNSNPSPAAMINAEFVYHTDSAFSCLLGQNHEIPCNFNEKSLLLDRAGLAGALFLPYYFKKLRHLLVQNSSAQRSLILIGAVSERFGEDVSITRIGKRNALSLLQYRTARCFVAGFFNSRKK